MKRRIAAEFPDFRNWGVVLRTLVVAELLRWAYGLSIPSPAAGVSPLLNEYGALYEPVLLFVVAGLAVLAPWMQRLSYAWASGMSVCVAVGVALLWHTLVQQWLPLVPLGSHWFSGTVAAWVSAAILFYFNWRHHRLSPAWSEARLMALQARIQPHFLFNSLNSVLSLLRVDPPKAEAMLEDLCDLYRHLLADSRQLVPLGQELELARTYVHIESIRHGARLQVQWECGDLPEQGLVPPLLLQPLLENAVRHGIEPMEQGGVITVQVSSQNQRLDIRVSNPFASGEAVTRFPTPGNHMALDNLRERLELHYDAEASLTTDCRNGVFEVHVRLPVQLP